MKNLLMHGLLFLAIPPFFVQCKNGQSSEQATSTKAAPAPEIRKSAYGVTPEGEAVDQYTLINGKGMEVTVITYGGIITWQVLTALVLWVGVIRLVRAAAGDRRAFAESRGVAIIGLTMGLLLYAMGFLDRKSVV